MNTNTGNRFIDALLEEKQELQNRQQTIDGLIQMYQTDAHNYQSGQFDGRSGNSGFDNSIRGSREVNRQMGNRGNNNSQFSNQGNSGGRSGSSDQNFNKGDDQNQRVTREGRVEHDADNVPQNQLIQWLNSREQSYMNQDGTFDRRTKEGRALYAAGLIDDDGEPVNKGGNQQFIGAGRS